MFVPERFCLAALICFVPILYCEASSPTWAMPYIDSNMQIDSSNERQCDDPLTPLLAVSTDSFEPNITVEVENFPDSTAFDVIWDPTLTQYVLKCAYDSLLTLGKRTFVVILTATSTHDGASSVIRVNVIDDGYPADPVIALSNSTILVAFDAYETGETLLTTVEVTNTDVDNVTLSMPNTTQFQATGFSIEIIGSLQELDNPYELQIVAIVDGDSSRSSTATLTLSLQSRPVFTNIDDNDEIYMCETDYGGDVILNLTATDDDNDDYTFSIVSVDPEIGETFFDISGDTLIVTDGIQMGTFDVDAINAVTRYTLELRVSDAYFNSSVTIFINVEDFNDNQPTFIAQMPANISLLESTEPGASIYQVSVTDNDLTEENKNFTFSLEGSTAFEIDRFNGTIYLGASSEPLNYETQSEYSLTVSVNDTGDPDTVYPNTGIVQVTVETAPEITNLAAPVTIKQNESTAEETVVFTLEVQDDDQLPASDIVTCIILEESNPGVFELNSYDIVLREALDAETTVSYTLKFRCTDGQYQTESAVLKIAVTDVNDNNPSITVNNGLTFREDVKTIVTFTVSDGDVQSPNNNVTVEIISGNDNGYFEMNENNEVIVISTPMSMTDNEFQLVLLASDGGDPQLTSTANVTFTLDPDAIDECDSVECANSAPCTSYLNDYFCDCTPGWKGLLCNIECTDNKHGQDCTQNCDCNATRIATNAQDQMCDPVNGVCRCNAFWSGTKCETDINECNTVGTCDTSENLVCENSIGSFDCVCETHYKDVRGTCEEYFEKSTIPEGKIATENILDIPVSECSDLKFPSIYKITQNNLEEMILKTVADRVNSVMCYDLSCGSLKFKTVYFTNDTFEEVVLLTKRLEELKTTGSIVYDGNTVPLSIIDIGFTKAGNDSSILQVRKICEGSVCYKCEGVKSVMKCRVIPDDHQALIWGLGAFMLGMIFLGAILIIGIICYKRYKALEKNGANGYRQRLKSMSKPRARRHMSDREFRSSKWHNGDSFDRFPKVMKNESFKEPSGLSPNSFYRMQGLNERSGFERPPLSLPY
ncbi:hypothetical protein ACF0H5_009244 [Mactra antiquata]